MHTHLSELLYILWMLVILNLRKYSLFVRIINIWNSLPVSVINVNSVNTFKSIFDWFWANQELIFSYKKYINRNVQNFFVYNVDSTSF